MPQRFRQALHNGQAQPEAFAPVTLRVAQLMKFTKDAPSVKAPVSFTVTEDVAGNLVFANDAFADPDSTSLTVTLSVKDIHLSFTRASPVVRPSPKLIRSFQIPN